MKHSSLAIIGLLFLAAAVGIWLLGKMIQLVVILGVIGLIAVCIGVILFNNDRLKKIGHSDKS
ncbi:hypothetical protein E5161_03530 [Cohnella pontilimi]|uniref:Uncharacterized protein n=1 Tax=Cohnella pontilimi TaxID=2564100 RepID=A0A4U0FLL8_9BACL|nr:hypothetical protein [Cohnella pontilimi]TJY44462.1 hypothetical protein E5161_03530 [Cohnella pontilimi]